MVRDSRIERVEPNNAFRGGEKFQLVQPLVVHGGLMPKDVVSVEAGPWDERGRRPIRYIGSRLNKPMRMEQAIIEIGPHVVKFRGVDGFWVGVIETGQIPRDVLASVLSRVEQKNVAERERVVRFMMDMGWNAEARKELDRLVRDFPQADLKERAENARQFIMQAEASDRRGEVAQRRKAQQYSRAAELLKTFRREGRSNRASARGAETSSGRTSSSMPPTRQSTPRSAGSRAGCRRPARKFWKEPVAEVTKALAEAPDAVRDRFAAWRKAKSEPGITDQASFALAMSSYVAEPTMPPESSPRPR